MAVLERSQDSSVSVVTGVGARRREIVAPFPAGQDTFIFPQTSGKRLGDHRVSCSMGTGTSYSKGKLAGGGGVKLTTLLFLMSRLRMRGTVPPLPHVPSWHAQGLSYILLERVACFAV